MCKHVVVVQRVSSCASGGLSDVGKPVRRPRTPPVFPRCGHVHARAMRLHSQTSVSICCSDDLSSMPNVQLLRAHMMLLCCHTHDMAPDAAS